MEDSKEVEDMSLTEKAKRHRFSAMVMVSAIMWTGMHWGFVSFSATILHEVEGMSYTKIGSFVPTFGGVYIISTFLLGLVAERVNHKLLLLAGLLLIGGGQLLFITNVYPMMIGGFAVIGVGYSAWTLVPYVQIRLLCGHNQKRFEFWYMAVELFFVLSFSLGRLMMMASTTYINEDSKFVWRLPWLVCMSMVGLHFVLLLLFGWFPQPFPKQNEVKETSKSTRLSYKEKLRNLYCNPVALLLLFGSMFNAFCTYGVAAWAPTVATERFGHNESKETINITISMAMLAAWPLGMVVMVLALMKSDTLKRAVRISFGFVLVSAVALAGYGWEEDKFLLHVGFMVIFAMSGNFPMVFYKNLPNVLGLSPSMKVFALSRFTLLYSIFGDIAGWLLTGVFIDEFGVSNTVWIITAANLMAVFCWGVPTVWSFFSRGPIHERSLQEASHARALKNWGQLSSATFARIRWSSALQSSLFNGRSTGLFGWLLNQRPKGVAGAAELTAVEQLNAVKAQGSSLEMGSSDAKADEEEEE